MFTDDSDEPPTLVYQRLQDGPLSGSVAALSSPKLPLELSRPRPLLPQVVRRLRFARRLELAVQIAHEVAMLHRTGASAVLTPDTIAIGLTGYPELTTCGAARASSAKVAADVYAIGRVIYYLFTNEEAPVTLGATHYHALGLAIGPIVHRCAASHPTPWRSAEAVADALESVHARHAGGFSPLGWLPSALTGAAALVLVAGTFM